MSLSILFNTLFPTIFQSTKHIVNVPEIFVQQTDPKIKCDLKNTHNPNINSFSASA